MLYTKSINYQLIDPNLLIFKKSNLIFKDINPSNLKHE